MDITTISFVTIEGLKEFLAKCKETFATKSEIPTAVSALTNDSGYTTKTEVQTMIDAIVSADGKDY